MQDYKAITPQFSVAGILSSGDLAKFKAMGFLTLISNLPDEEVKNGFTSDKAKAEAETLGITYIHMPASGATVTDQDVVEKFANILENADKPVIAHCRSGTRSSILWSMVAARTTKPAKVIAHMEALGFELDFLEDEFEDQWQLTNASPAKIAA